jgi:hypothetical protein
MLAFLGYIVSQFVHLPGEIYQVCQDTCVEVEIH